MTTVIGAIDNAGIWKTSYHLVFTNNEVLQFLVMKGREKFMGIYKADMSNPSRMVPVAGAISGYSTTRAEVQMIVGENIRRGKEIEASLDERMKNDPASFTRINYESIESAELSNGTMLSLPHLLLRTGGKNLKFNLLHSNYQGRGKLDEATFSSYMITLQKALGHKLTVKS